MEIYKAIEKAHRRMLTLGVKSMWAVIINDGDYWKLKQEHLSRVRKLCGGTRTEETINDIKTKYTIFGLKIIPCIAQMPGNVDIVDRWTAREIEAMDNRLRGIRTH